MKIFQMNDCDWYAAENLDDARRELASTMGCETVEEYLKDYPEDPPYPFELDAEQMEKFIFTEVDEDTGDPRGGDEKTFRQKLDEMIAAGEKFPTFFASTEY